MWSGKLIIAGDFNVHWDKQSNPERQQLEDLLHSFGLIQHVNDSTHSDGHTLDLLITHADDNLVSSCLVGDF